MAKLSIALDARRLDRNGEAPVVYTLSHKSVTVHISTTLRIAPQYWQAGRVVNHPRRRQLNEMLEIGLSTYRYKLMQLATSGQLPSMSAVEVKAAITDAPTREEKVEPDFIEFFDKKIASIKNASTRGTYITAKNKLLEYMTEKGMQRLLFGDLTREYIIRYDKWLGDQLANNTRVLFITKVKAVFNDAVKKDIVSRDPYPFASISLRLEETEKRYLEPQKLRRIINAELTGDAEEARDIFALSFYCAGMNLIDLLNMPKQDSLDSISYNRAKTGVHVEFDTPDAAKMIIEKYRGEEHLLDIMERRGMSYHNYLGLIDYNLRKVVKIINASLPREEHINDRLSVYWARHTWATIAADLDMPDEVIDAALAHKPKYRMTAVYIRRNRNKVTEALNKVIDYIKFGRTAGRENDRNDAPQQQ